MMTDEKKYTQRDMVLAQRTAFEEGAHWAWDGHWRRDTRPDEYAEAAIQRYPIPKISRPRVMVDRWGMAWKYERESFWYSLGTNPIEWKHNDEDSVVHELTPGRVALWNNLLARPTEEVDA